LRVAAGGLELVISNAVKRKVCVFINLEKPSDLLHTQEVTGSSPVAPTILNLPGEFSLSGLYAKNGGSPDPKPILRT
jgi:hypothetical protein